MKKSYKHNGLTPLIRPGFPGVSLRSLFVRNSDGSIYSRGQRVNIYAPTIIVYIIVGTAAGPWSRVGRRNTRTGRLMHIAQTVR